MKNKNNIKPSIDESIREHLNEMSQEEAQILFPQKVFDKLPHRIKDITDAIEAPREKSGALVPILVIVSGVLPNYRSVDYNFKKYSPNLYGYLYGSAGCGKGILNTIKRLVLPIHKKKLEESEIAYQKYLRDKEEGNNENLFPPKEKKLIIAGNSTKTSLIKDIANNAGRAIICETETDTLITAMNQQHGSFSDLLRGSAEHESISISRVSEGSYYIDRPEITLALSSTPNQLKSFIYDIEDGMFSRFIYYYMEGSPIFENMFNKNGDVLNEAIAFVSELLSFIHDELEASDENNPLLFKLTDQQLTHFVKFFQRLKDEYREYFNESMDSVVNRLAVNFVRICMILSILAIYDTDREGKYTDGHILVCRNREYKCAIEIIRILSENAIKAQEIIMKGKSYHLAASLEEKQQQLELKAKAYQLFMDNPTLHPSDACRALNINPTTRRSTIKRWFDKWRKDLGAKHNED